MTFLSPWRLLALIGVALLALAYVYLQRRRQAYALRFASSDLFDTVAGSSPGGRRHVPAVVFLLASSIFVMAFARPTQTVMVPRERATVIVAIDVSLSMEADDVDPNRLEAAQAAAIRFIEELPPTLNVGIVSFAGAATVLVQPTQDRLPAQNAVNSLELAERTAIGEAIFASLGALNNVPDDGTEELPPAAIVLLSDGETTVGRPDSEAVAAAMEAEVPVSTIAFGTEQGVIFYDNPETPEVENDRVPVAVAVENLEAIAAGTGGAFFSAASLEELEAVYADIGSAIGFQEAEEEISDWFVAAGLIALALAATFSLAWFQRIP